jgi:hypothetical protein
MEKKKRFAFLTDDGWRYEKEDLFNYLRGRIEFEILTHDALTADCLQDSYPVRRLPTYPLRRGFLYSTLMFFARELDTNLVNYRKRIKYHLSSFPVKVLYRLRDLMGALGLRRYSYCRALELLYSRSNRYAEELAGFDALVYTPVSVKDKRIIYEARKKGLEIVSWVFSWDNPMKDNEFMPNADHYLVWNRENVLDLERYHGIPPEKCHIVGPVQFDYLLNHKPRTASRESGNERYVLYACTAGKVYHLEQEEEFILKIRDMLDEIDPGVELKVRPYPFRKNKDFGYEALKRRPGISVLDFGHLQKNEVVVGKKDLDEKFDQIDRALCMIHLGSTIGLEASFLDTPILHLDYTYPGKVPDWLDIKHPRKNEHLTYVIDYDYPNTIGNKEDLRRSLREIVEGQREKYMPYSEKLQKFAHPLPVDSYKKVFYETLRSL